MALVVATARMGYKADQDWLDVTLQGNERRIDKNPDEPMGHRRIGFCFAPSPGIVYPYLSERKWGRETPELWVKYVEDYTAEMRQSYKRYRQAWDLLLSWERVVLLCMCTNHERCHRTVLGGILGKLGATFEGEIPCR